MNQFNSEKTAEDYIRSGSDYYEKQHLDQAISEYSKAIAVDPASFVAYNWRGYVYDKKGKLIAFYPEMGDPIIYKHAAIINAVNAAIEDIEGLKGVEELRATATKTLASSVDALVVAAETNIKSGVGAKFTEEEIAKLNPRPEPPIRHGPHMSVVVVKR